MKILFVCQQNVGRSQIAKAFYNKLTHSQSADSAGTHVHEPGQTIRERKAASASKNFYVLDVMRDVGIDMSDYKRQPLDEQHLSNYDMVVSMADKKDTPGWLLRSPKYRYWDVTDPRGQDYEFTAKVRDDIKARVQSLIDGAAS